MFIHSSPLLLKHVVLYLSYHLPVPNGCIRVRCVAASVNMALDQPTYQSSISSAGHAALAVDGIAHGVFQKGSCTHTQSTPSPWWAVDLGTQRLVSVIQVANRVNSRKFS